MPPNVHDSGYKLLFSNRTIAHGRIDPADQAALATTLQSKEEVANMLRTFTREKQAEFERGRQEGIEEGLEQGIEQGVELGVELGVLKVAHNMLAAGIAPATIAEFTGLALDAVLVLQEDAHSGNGKH